MPPHLGIIYQWTKQFLIVFGVRVVEWDIRVSIQNSNGERSVESIAEKTKIMPRIRNNTTRGAVRDAESVMKCTIVTQIPSDTWQYQIRRFEGVRALPSAILVSGIVSIVSSRYYGCRRYSRLFKKCIE